MGHQEISEILVLKVNDQIIGMVSLLYSISTALGGKVAIVEDMVIDKAHRNKGFGKELFKEAIRFSKHRNCLRLTLLTDYNDNTAIHLYKSFGFKTSEMIPMRLVHE